MPFPWLLLLFFIKINISGIEKCFCPHCGALIGADIMSSLLMFCENVLYLHASVKKDSLSLVWERRLYFLLLFNKPEERKKANFFLLHV